jgi:hypothetical protein
VFDFSSAKSAGEAGSPLTAPVLATEIGFYDAQVGGEADTWSTYWYNDFIYANDGLARTNINRGFDVFKILLNGQQLRGRKFHHMNPQTQEVFQVQGG